MAAEKLEIKQQYIAAAPELLAFVDWPWPQTDWESLIQARAKTTVPRQLLVQELTAQNSALPSTACMLDNIAALAEPTTFTVTTGHQVCLMGGPLFTLYKIATTIALAQQLAQRYPQYRFVPLLWMATEDHDWEEVNHFFTAFGEKIVYPGSFQGPVGRHILEPSIQDILPERLPSELKAFYAPGRSMADAFRSLMHHLFGQFGLVIMDADRAVFKQEFVPIMVRELNADGMAAPVRATTAALEELGYKAQIYPREINLFYIGDGNRRLIDRYEGGYKLKDGEQQWTAEALQAELKQYPQHFSPNVALRPVYQETLLPNLAYIGGWAEVGYWMQLRDGFSALGAFYPMVVPRLHATLFHPAQAQEWQALGFALDAIVQPLHILNDQHVLQHYDESPLDARVAAIDEAFLALTQWVEEVDPTQAMGLRAEQARADNAFDTLRKKLRKSLRNRNPQPYQAIAALKNAIEPENNSQQRILNFTAFNSTDPVNLAKILVEHAAWDQADTQWIVLP